MFQKRFSFKSIFALFALTLLLLSATSPAFGYDYGPWNMDGYFKSQFGVFTEGKPFNDADNGYTAYNRGQGNIYVARPGSNDNMATARQQMRWNVNGQVSDSIAVRAEILGAWEPDYPGENNTQEGGYKHINANFYNSFDWREVTVEYKPTYSHAIKFGRQIINWGEALSGRVADQCNPVDSRYLLGFTNLEETYMPLWMFRGTHDFFDWNTNIEWIAAPIWQADDYEHSRSMTSSGQRYGDGTVGTPWYRFAANPEARVNRLGGAGAVLSYSTLNQTKVYGAPFSTMYHGSDLLGIPGPVRPLTRAEAVNIGLPTTAYPGVNSVLLATEIPTTDASAIASNAPDFTDHNFKNTRWGIKTKHMLWGADLGFSFFQGPADSGNYHYRYKTSPTPYLVFERVVPRYNTFGLFGNYQFPWAVMIFEGAYKPGREFHKDLFGIRTHAGRLDNIEKVDIIHTMFGVTREQNIDFLNKYNVFTIRGQWQAQYYMENMDGLAEVTTYMNEAPRMDNEFMVSISTAYSYRKYNPGVTFVMNPRGQLYSSAAFSWVPGGFNDRLNVSVGYTNIWGANEYSTRTVFAAKNDLAVLTVQYNFY
ncbi:MAG: hypothetical protein FP816_13965 [Desulfobacteraceae bacterium]|nr:hypothetical protein [Desulfobacteraceae bacterium]MBU4053227.1 hypothetical protein [Pseudomonadota bacterium]